MTLLEEKSLFYPDCIWVSLVGALEAEVFLCCGHLDAILLVKGMFDLGCYWVSVLMVLEVFFVGS